jgi:hypothetical protein
VFRSDLLETSGEPQFIAYIVPLALILLFLSTVCANFQTLCGLAYIANECEGLKGIKEESIKNPPTFINAHDLGLSADKKREESGLAKNCHLCSSIKQEVTYWGDAIICPMI